MSDPWPKVSALLGAVLALALLDVPLPFVVLIFVFGLFVSDTFGRVSSFWKLLGLAFLVAVGLGIGSLITGAQTEKSLDPCLLGPGHRRPDQADPGRGRRR